MLCVRLFHELVHFVKEKVVKAKERSRDPLLQIGEKNNTVTCSLSVLPPRWRHEPPSMPVGTISSIQLHCCRELAIKARHEVRKRSSGVACQWANERSSLLFLVSISAAIKQLSHLTATSHKLLAYLFFISLIADEGYGGLH